MKIIGMILNMRLIFAWSALLLLTLTACSNDKAKDDQEEENSGIIQNYEITLSREQFKTAGMKIGDPVSFEFKQTISTRGRVKASPSGHALVSSRIPGKVVDIKALIGDNVRKGQVLFSIEGKEIILLQQEYAIIIQTLRSLKASYERQLALTEENVSAGKNLVNSESEYKSVLAKAEGLKAQLKLINLSPKAIEEGIFYDKVNILSPINGVITKQSLVLGSNIDPHDNVAEIVNAEKFQLELNIFERDVQNVNIGQTVHFYKPESQLIQYEALIERIGKSVDPQSKSIRCIASIRSPEKTNFVQNLFVEATIITCFREALAIPDEAVVLEDDHYYVYQLKNETEDSLVFTKTNVTVGVIQQDHAEILEEELSNILIEGAYNLSGLE